jgi:predicted O-methyltransferase YrrM
MTDMFSPKITAVMDKVDALREQVSDHWQIPRAEANVLAQLVRIGRFRSICEIGVSYGFSTLHLAAAASEHGGHIHAIDIDPKKIAAATKHLTEAGLIDTVTLHEGDARQVLGSLTPAEPFDFAFIDAVKDQSAAYLEALKPHLAERCVLATDNTSTHPDELAGFVDELRRLAGGRSCPVPIGNGFELTLIER